MENASYVIELDWDGVGCLLGCRTSERAEDQNVVTMEYWIGGGVGFWLAGGHAVPLGQKNGVPLGTKPVCLS